MPQNDPSTSERTISSRLYEVDSSDPRSELVDRSGLSRDSVSQINRVMRALSELRAAEQAMSEASQKFMKLGGQDMRALHYLIVSRNHDQIVTPGMLGAHLGASKASITKILNRLETAGHIARSVHPSDRRAFAISVTAETERSAMDTVGRQQAKRFHAAARLNDAERETVIRFLDDMRAELSLDGVAWAAGNPETNDAA